VRNRVQMESVAGTSRDPGQPQPDAGLEPVDPLAVFLADPESHLSDILNLYCRIYKKKLLWSFMQTALSELNLDRSQTLSIADVGASMGFDALYLLRKVTHNFGDPLPWDWVCLSLVEGDQKLIAGGERILEKAFASTRVDFAYYHHPLVERLPLPEESHHLVICSEVVEHLEKPEKLLQELYRILQPGGFLILTTANSHILLERLRRVPVWLSGQHRRNHARSAKDSVSAGKFVWNGQEYPIFGNINLNSTRGWERLSIGAGFELAEYGTYESIRHVGGSKSPLGLLGYFTFGAMVYYLMPKRIGRFFGDTTALLLRKPSGNC
jgi:SAM-dependent methyltransferase